MTKRRRINRPSKTLQAILTGSGNGESVPTIAVARNNVVETMYHQLLPLRSWANIFVAAINSGPVLINKIRGIEIIRAQCTHETMNRQGRAQNDS